ncbi:MAG: UvrB/UvrC motif-containing protein [bacterium]|nr:UvrB/UvrC motif-containing protein [bacterium]
MAGREAERGLTGPRDWTPDALGDLPETPGVYMFLGPGREILYIGKSVNLRDRVRSYFVPDGGHSHRTRRLKHEVTAIRTWQLGSELEALLVENRFIKRYMPRYNVRGRRRTHHPFLQITGEAVPRVRVTRVPVDDGSACYGPFPGAAELAALVQGLEPLLGIRTCEPLPSAPCLQLELGRCLGPCRGGEALEAHAEAIDWVHAIGQGRGDEVLTRLEERMVAAAGREHFERAARLRDQHRLLERVLVRQRRMQAEGPGLDGIVALPAAQPGRLTLLAVRRARWTGTLSIARRDLGTARGRERVDRFLRWQFQDTPAPPARIPPDRLDEIMILASWLERDRAAFVSVGSDLAEAYERLGRFLPPAIER